MIWMGGGGEVPVWMVVRIWVAVEVVVAEGICIYGWRFEFGRRSRWRLRVGFADRGGGLVLGGDN